MAFQGGRQLVTISGNLSSYGNGTRILGTTYTNTSGRPMLIIITARCTTAAVTDSTLLNAILNGVTFEQVGIVAGSATSDLYFCIVLMVTNGSTYSFAAALAGTGAVVIQKWIEILLIGSTGAI